jgi:lipoyl(octanoyl) transferase 2
MKIRSIALPGLTHHAYADHLQSLLLRRVLDLRGSCKRVPPAILTAQFHPVYTAGLRAKKEDVQALSSLGAEFYQVPRGGQVTFHGPGQLVAYPVVDLRAHGLGARMYVCLLETAIIKTLAEYDVVGRRTENVGVWVGDNEKKIAAVGVRLRRFVASHGVAVNVSTDLGWFDKIVACGLEGMRSTSLREEGVCDVGVEDVGRVFVGKMAEMLDGVDGVENVSPDEVEEWEDEFEDG